MLPRLVETAFGMVATVWVAAYQPEHSRAYDVQIDDAFDAADIAAIHQSLDAWRTAVPELRLYARRGPACDPSDTPRGAHPLICIVLVASDDLPDNTLGFTAPQGSAGSTVALPAGQTQDTIAHEIGHAMGLKHSKKCGSLMYPARYSDGIRCDNTKPTPADIRAWHAVAR